MAPLAALAVAIPEALAAAGTAAGTAATAAGTAAAAGGTAASIGSVGSILGLAGTAASVVGSIQQGKAAKREAEFAAMQEQRKGAETLAASTRQQEERRMETSRLISKQKSIAAADGGGSVNPTILDVIGDTAARGEYLAKSDLYNGANAAAGMMDQASVYKAKGKNAQAASWIEAVGTGASGGYKFGQSRNWWA